MQLLLGHTKLESTVRFLGIEVDDPLEMAEQTECRPEVETGARWRRALSGQLLPSSQTASAAGQTRTVDTDGQALGRPLTT